MHDIIDKRSLRFAQIIANRLEADPSLVDVARRNLSRWKEKNGGVLFPDLQRWEEIIENDSLEKILELLRSESEEATQLRQSNPFVGIISHQERWRILKEFKQ